MEIDQEPNSTLHDCWLLLVPRSLTATIRPNLARSWSEMIFTEFGFRCAKLPINLRETPVIHLNSLALRGEGGPETQQALQPTWMMTLWPLRPWPESSAPGGSAARWIPVRVIADGLFSFLRWSIYRTTLSKLQKCNTLQRCFLDLETMSCKEKNIARISEKAQILICKYSQRAQRGLVEFCIIPIQFYHYFK